MPESGTAEVPATASSRMPGTREAGEARRSRRRDVAYLIRTRAWMPAELVLDFDDRFTVGGDLRLRRLVGHRAGEDALRHLAARVDRARLAVQAGGDRVGQLVRPRLDGGDVPAEALRLARL